MIKSRKVSNDNMIQIHNLHTNSPSFSVMCTHTQAKKWQNRFDQKAQKPKGNNQLDTPTPERLKFSFLLYLPKFTQTRDFSTQL